MAFFLQSHRDLWAESYCVFAVFFFFCKGEIFPQVLRKIKQEPAEERKVKCQMSQPILLSTEHGHLLNTAGNRNNSGVCFAISCLRRRRAGEFSVLALLAVLIFQWAEQWVLIISLTNILSKYKPSHLKDLGLHLVIKITELETTLHSQFWTFCYMWVMSCCPTECSSNPSGSANNRGTQK